MECSALLLVATAVATTVAAVFAWIFKLRSDYNFFNKHRIAGPDPELLWGNWLQLKRNRIEVGLLIPHGCSLEILFSPCIAAHTSCVVKPNPLWQSVFKYRHIVNFVFEGEP